MTCYVDVAAARIGRYLARTPTLRGRREASAALVKARDLVNTPGFPKLARRNEEAGEVDGVLSLVVEDPSRRDQVVREVLAWLRELLPGAEFQVAWGEADNYVQALTREIVPRKERGDVLLDLPAVAEFPLAKLCEICRVDPAIAHVHLGADDGSRWACADCRMRHPAGRAQRRGRTAEQRLQEAAGFAQSPPGFNELAELGTSRTKATHLATVHADGNAVGRFFARVAEADGVDRARVVQALSACVFDALAAATCHVRRAREDTLCAIPHLVGGDDVLVSLPADRGWQFVARFLTEFGERSARLVTSLGIADLDPPTMSAGLVFARRDAPFTLIVEEAERAVREAKSAGAGQSPWIQFVDLTRDGPGGAGQPVPLAALRHHERALTELANTPESSRHRDADLLRAGKPDMVAARAQRLGRDAGIRPFLDTSWATAGAARDREESDRDTLVIGLDQALRIARWWR